jgi:hypothetical protein
VITFIPTSLFSEGPRRLGRGLCCHGVDYGRRIGSNNGILQFVTHINHRFKWTDLLYIFLIVRPQYGGRTPSKFDNACIIYNGRNVSEIYKIGRFIDNQDGGGSNINKQANDSKPFCPSDKVSIGCFIMLVTRRKNIAVIWYKSPLVC